MRNYTNLALTEVSPIKKSISLVIHKLKSSKFSSLKSMKNFGVFFVRNIFILYKKKKKKKRAKVVLREKGEKESRIVTLLDCSDLLPYKDYFLTLCCSFSHLALCGHFSLCN